MKKIFGYASLGAAAGVVTFVGLNLVQEKSNTSISDEASPEGGSQVMERESPFSSFTDPTVPWAVQVERIGQIDITNLSARDLAHLHQLLHHRPSEHHRNDWSAVANEIMSVLRHPDLPLDPLIKTLREVLQDSEAHPVLRDYAVQHLAQCINPKFFEDPTQLKQESINEVQTLFSEVIMDPSLTYTSVPGTALTMLSYLHRSRKELGISASVPLSDPAARLLSKMVSGDVSIPIPLRTSAIYAASSFEIEALHKPISDLAHRENIDPSLRLTAISALGSYRTESDRDLLVQLAASDNKYRYAAKAALQHFSH